MFLSHRQSQATQISDVPLDSIEFARRTGGPIYDTVSVSAQ
jgi:hypothetical protein